jgi:hypothetical protein
MHSRINGKEKTFENAFPLSVSEIWFSNVGDIPIKKLTNWLYDQWNRGIKILFQVTKTLLPYVIRRIITFLFMATVHSLLFENIFLLQGKMPQSGRRN